MNQSPSTDEGDAIRFAARAVADAIKQNRRVPTGLRVIDTRALALGTLINYLGDEAPTFSETDTLCPMSVLVGRALAGAGEIMRQFDARHSNS